MLLLKATLLYLCIYIIPLSYQEVKHVKTKVYGPGLDPIHIILPARYITVELPKDYNNETNGAILNFKAKGQAVDHSRPCRIWSNVLNRKDGSFILRYRLYEPCRNFQLEILLGNQHLAESPYTFGTNIIKHELCYCPQRDISQWLKRAQCGNVPEQIFNDLKHFDRINWDQIRSEVIKRFNKPEAISICHYVIIGNKLHRNCYGKHVGFKMFMDNIMLSLLRKIDFPDMEFFVNLGDWPLVKKEAVPVFSWCGSEDTYDIVMPTYDITESTLENMGRVTLDMLSVQGNTELPWEQRASQAFWRGRDSNSVRFKLIDIAREQPEMFNVSMTNFFFYRDKQEEYGPKTPHVSFYKFFDYKYQIGIDGTVASYRLPYLLAGGSLVMKQSSKYYEHFYHLMEPNEHYVALDEDLSDLTTKLDWALKNDVEARSIAQKAHQFVNEHLLPKDIYCYHAHLFNEYAQLLAGETQLALVAANMEEVPQPKESQLCHCESQHDEL